VTAPCYAENEKVSCHPILPPECRVVSRPGWTPQQQFNPWVTARRGSRPNILEVHAPQRVVVTGGAGFIGSHLVDALLGVDTDEVVVVDNLTRGRLANLADKRADPRLVIMQADIRDYASVRQALKGASTVYHLAAQSTVMGAARDIDYTFGTNVTGTFNVLKAAAASGVDRVVFTSSREVYGEPLTLPVDESHPLMSINLYGSSKVAGEALCRAFARERGLRTLVLRLANVFGPRDFGRVIPHWIEQAQQGSDLLVYGGDQIIDFVWIAEVVEALLRAGGADVALPPINVASGTGTKILDLARRILQLASHSSQVRVMPRRSIEVSRFVGNPQRMVQLLGLTPPADPLSNLVHLVRPLAGAAA
jgi:UDP-glucose 4-epimerase